MQYRTSDRRSLQTLRAGQFVHSTALVWPVDMSKTSARKLGRIVPYSGSSGTPREYISMKLTRDAAVGSTSPNP